MTGIITGASSGLGRCFAEELLETYPSLTLWMIGRNTDKLLPLQGKYKDRIKVFKLDLSLEEDLNRFQEILFRKKPKVKLFIHSAGVGMIGDFKKISLSDMLPMVDINVKATTSLLSMVIPYMVKNARILLVSSSAAFFPQPGFSVYAASKAYVNSLGFALRKELKADKIYVTLACPGPMPTAFFDTAQKYENVAAYKKRFMYDPKKVCKASLKAMKHKKVVSIYGISMKALFLCSEIVPGFIIRRFLGVK